MKHSLLTAAFVLGSLTSATAFAQAPAQDASNAVQQPAKHHDPHKEAMHLGKRLGLSADQTAKVEPILAQHQDQVMAIRQNASLTPEERKSQMHEAHRSMQQQLAGVLTPDQMQQLRAMRKGQRQHNDGTAPAPSGV